MSILFFIFIMSLKKKGRCSSSDNSKVFLARASMPDIRRLVNQISLKAGGKQKALKKLRKKMKKHVAKLKKMLKNNVGSYLWHTIASEMLLDLKVSRRIKVRYGGRKFIIKPTNWGLGLFAGETIPKNTRLTSDKFPFGKCRHIKVNPTGFQTSIRNQS